MPTVDIVAESNDAGLVSTSTGPGPDNAINGLGSIALSSGQAADYYGITGDNSGIFTSSEVFIRFRTDSVNIPAGAILSSVVLMPHCISISLGTAPDPLIVYAKSNATWAGANPAVGDFRNNAQMVALPTFGNTNSTVISAGARFSINGVIAQINRSGYTYFLLVTANQTNASMFNYIADYRVQIAMSESGANAPKLRVAYRFPTVGSMVGY